MTAVEAAARVLEERLGLDPACIGDATLAAAVERRVRRLGLGSPARYAERLDGDAAEAVALAEEIVVCESWFFRDGKPFELLARVLGARRGARPVRVLCAPCARGEEPYSVVVALLAGGFTPDDVAVDAIDLSQQALDEARRGEYGPRALRSPADAPERRWLAGFSDAGANGRFTIVPAVRQRVRFRQASLLDLERAVDPGYDAVLCRNALIYLSASARSALAEACWRLLAPGGLLVVGHAEAGSLLDRWFERVPEAGTFAFVRRDAPYTATTGVSCAAPAEPDDIEHGSARNAVQAAPPACAGDAAAATRLRRRAERPPSPR